ncbi:MAG: hypothetical protein H0V10_07740 [Geodermatophilaceae bacterium]|nr:hypothetical protein [Geodermatophilaceae bacterium]
MGISLGAGPSDARSGYVTTWRLAPATRETAQPGTAAQSDSHGLVSLSLGSWLAASFRRHSPEDD